MGNLFVVDDGSCCGEDIAPFVSLETVWAPEPTTSVLLGFGLAGLGVVARHRRAR